MAAAFLAFALPVLASDSGLETLADEAVAANPSLEAMRAQERALRARAEVAGAWTDPMLSIEYSNAPVTSFGLDHPMAGLQFRLQQTLRTPAWSRLQREASTHRADAKGFSVEEGEVWLRAAVHKTWWDLTQTRMLKSVTQSHLAQTEDLLEAAEARYTTGSVGQHALLRLGVLRDTLEDELGDFDRADVELTAALHEALTRESSEGFVTPPSVQPLPPPAAADWVALAQDSRPLLQRIEAERHAAEQQAAFSRVDALPDINVWAGYRVRTVQTSTDVGTDMVSVGVGVPIPTGSARRSNGARTAWLEEASAKSATLAASEDGIHADMQAHLAGWQRAWEKVQTYDSVLIPGAEATLTATQGDFSVGRADFASLFEAEVALLNLERARIVAAIETHTHQVQTEAILGTSPLVESP